MNSQQQPRFVSFIIDQPFDAALKSLRRELAREGLCVPCELNISARLRAELGLSLKDSIVLYVDLPILLLEATVFTPAAALYIPEPVALAVCADDKCKAVVRSIEPLLDTNLPVTARESVLVLHERILKAIQTIGGREGMFHYPGRREAVPA